MGLSNPDAPSHQRQSMILVPMDSKGVTIKPMVSSAMAMVTRSQRGAAGWVKGQNSSSFAVARCTWCH